MKYVWVSLGGVLGANARLLLGGWILARAGGGFPWGTLGVNLLGCLCIGGFGAVAPRLGWGDPARLFLVTGFLGAFTTFSAFGAETHHLLTVQRQPGVAGLYVALSVALGIGMVFAGHALGRAIPVK